MKNGRFSDAQIMGILKQAESGVPVSKLCREHGMSSASFYKWRAKFGGKSAHIKIALTLKFSGPQCAMIRNEVVVTTNQSFAKTNLRPPA